MKSTYADPNLLRLLKKLKTEDTKALIPYLSSKSLHCLRKTCQNLLFEDLSLKRSVKSKIQKKLKGKEKVFKAIANPNNSIKPKRKLLTQEGGFLATIGMYIFHLSQTIH